MTQYPHLSPTKRALRIAMDEARSRLEDAADRRRGQMNMRGPLDIRPGVKTNYDDALDDLKEAQAAYDAAARAYHSYSDV